MSKRNLINHSFEFKGPGDVHIAATGLGLIVAALVVIAAIANHVMK